MFSWFKRHNPWHIKGIDNNQLKNSCTGTTLDLETWSFNWTKSEWLKDVNNGLKIACWDFVLTHRWRFARIKTVCQRISIFATRPSLNKGPQDLEKVSVREKRIITKLVFKVQIRTRKLTTSSFQRRLKELTLKRELADLSTRCGWSQISWTNEIAAAFHRGWSWKLFHH